MIVQDNINNRKYIDNIKGKLSLLSNYFFILPFLDNLNIINLVEREVVSKMTKNKKNMPEKDNLAVGLSLGICFGLSLGTLVGVLIDDIGLCLCLGVCVGLCIGVIVATSKDNKNK